MLRRHRQASPQGPWQLGTVRGKNLESLSLGISSEPLFELGELSRFGGCAAADPFGFHWQGRWYVFFEMFCVNSPNASISVAASDNLRDWEVLGVALQTTHHLSFPFVFEHDGTMYMMPESKSVRRVDLYRAIEFPLRWEFDRTVLRGRYMDASIVRQGHHYWLFTGCHSYWLKLFQSESPLGPWRPHWMPVARTYSKKDVRPGGRIVEVDGKLIRFAQDSQRYYGHQLRAMEITKLNRAWFAERPLFPEPLLRPEDDTWLGAGTHHLDLHRVDDEYVGFIDGCNFH